MIRTTLLSLTLIACNSFDAQENSREPSGSSYKIVDASDSINLDPERNDFVAGSVVMTLPELGLEVIEQEDTEVDTQPDSDHPGILGDGETTQEEDNMDGAVDDTYVKVLEIELLPEDSALTAELTAEQPKRIIALSNFPKAELEESKVKHSLKVLYPEENSLYLSEILESVVVAVESDADTIYLPFAAETIPEILFKGIDYALTEEVAVFDAYGERF